MLFSWDSPLLHRVFDLSLQLLSHRQKNDWWQGRVKEKWRTDWNEMCLNFKKTAWGINTCKRICQKKILTDPKRGFAEKAAANSAQVFRLFASLNACFCDNILVVASKQAKNNMETAGRWKRNGVRRAFLAYVRPFGASGEFFKHHSLQKHWRCIDASLFGHCSLFKWICAAQTRFAPITLRISN